MQQRTSRLQSTSLLRGKTSVHPDNRAAPSRFNPLPSCEGRRFSEISEALKRGASIHFPLAREDGILHPHGSRHNVLQSTSLLRGKTGVGIIAPTVIYASIHFPLAREDHNVKFFVEDAVASIHFPLAREDVYALDTSGCQKDASIHFPLAREDIMSCRKENLYAVASIHFPLAREDSVTFDGSENWGMLQSTSLLRGKTKTTRNTSCRKSASIHFPLAREDPTEWFSGLT